MDRAAKEPEHFEQLRLLTCADERIDDDNTMRNKLYARYDDVTRAKSQSNKVSLLTSAKSVQDDNSYLPKEGERERE